MINEDYVSLDTAILLKEKGFNEECHRYFYRRFPDGEICLSGVNSGTQNNSRDLYNEKVAVCPTIALALKWLREVHNWRISVWANEDGYVSGVFRGTMIFKDSYEEAAEAGLVYCLNNFI